LFALAVPILIFSPLAGAQQAQPAPTYTASLNPADYQVIEKNPRFGTVQGVLSSCPDSSEDGPYTQLFTYADSLSPLEGAPVASSSGIQLLKQGEKWIPDSATTTFEGEKGEGVSEIATSTSNSSGLITSTYTVTYEIGGAETGPVTESVVEVIQLGDGNEAELKTQYSYSASLREAQSGCFNVETYSLYLAGPISLVLQPYTPQTFLTLVDPMNSGGQILPLPSSVDPNSVPNAPGAAGLAADGVSAAAIVYTSFSSQPVTFTLTGTSTNSGDAPGGSIGGLTSFDPNYPSNPQSGSLAPIQVATPLDATTCNSSTDQAGTSNCTFLALLWAPATMPYSDADLLALTPEPITLTVTATQNDANGVQGSTSSSALLEAPPVVLVHGVWDSAATWNTFKQSMQQSAYPTSGLFAADYSVSNYLTFEDSATQIVLGRAVADALTEAAQQGVVARKVDVVAHSMGGLVTLYFEDQRVTLPTVVTLPANPIHKLVTIGTPYNGSGLATELWNIRNTPPTTLLLLNQLTIKNPLFEALCNDWGSFPSACTPTILLGATGHKIVSDVPNVDSAVQSLMSGIGPIPTPYTHSAVVGETDGIRATELFLNAVLTTYDPGKSVSSLLGTPNDAIVGASSQSANSSDSATVTGVIHTSLLPNASWAEWIPGYNLLDYPGETSSSAVFTQALSSLMGNALSGTVAQPQVVNSRNRRGATPTVTHSLRSAARPEAPPSSQQKALLRSE